LKGISDLVVCEKDGRSSWYAWLLENEFQALEGDDAKPILQQWIKEIAQEDDDDLRCMTKMDTLADK